MRICVIFVFFVFSSFGPVWSRQVEVYRGWLEVGYKHGVYVCVFLGAVLWRLLVADERNPSKKKMADKRNTFLDLAENKKVKGCL